MFVALLVGLILVLVGSVTIAFNPIVGLLLLVFGLILCLLSIPTPGG